MAFLTLEDPNAKIKGYRDPLGTLPIWVSFGRHVVTNLTLASSTVRGFTTHMLGRYFSGRLIKSERIPSDEAMNVFFRNEQLCAYIRHHAHGVTGSIRGIERVRKNLADGKGKVTIQTDRHGWILSDQKVYGLWGLYTVSSRASGFLPNETFGLTPLAEQFVEDFYGAALKPSLAALERLLVRGGRYHVKKNDKIYQSLATILNPNFQPEEIDFYGKYLRDAEAVPGTTPGRQARLVRYLDELEFLDSRTDRTQILTLAKRAKVEDQGLATALERIAILEAVLAPSDAIFQYALTKHGQPVKELAKSLHQAWGKDVPHVDPQGFEKLIPEIVESSSQAEAKALHKTAQALGEGDYEEAVNAIMEWNAAVTASRKGAAWLVRKSGRIDVRYKGGDRALPSGDALPQLWRNPYFLSSLKSVTRELNQAA